MASDSNILLKEIVLFLNRGGAPSYTEEGGIAVLNQKCIRDEAVSFVPARRTDIARKPIPKEKYIQPCDILVNSTGVGTLGRVAQVKRLSEPATVDSHVTIVRPNPAVVVPEYLGYVLRSRQDEIENLAEGSTGQTELSRSKLGEIRIRLPALHVQDSVAQILGRLDDKIELNRRMNATLEAMARALFQSWFVDFDPVYAKAAGHHPAGMDRATAALFPSSFHGSELGEIPAGWIAQPLPAVIEVNPRRTLSKGAVAPYLDMKNLPTQGHSAEDVVDREFSSGTKFRKGDTLLARITPCLENGKTGLVDFLKDDQVGWGSTEYIVFAPKPPLTPEFCYLLARSGKLRTHAIQNMTGTSGRQRVPAECFNSFLLAVPSPEIAKRFGELVTPLFAKIKANSDQCRTLATLRDTLLPRLLNGELPVATCSKEVEHS